MTRSTETTEPKVPMPQKKLIKGSPPRQLLNKTLVPETPATWNQLSDNEIEDVEDTPDKPSKQSNRNHHE